MTLRSNITPCCKHRKSLTTLLFYDFKPSIFAFGGQIIAEMTLNGEILFTQRAESLIKCAALAPLPLYSKNRFFVTGHANGAICFWSNSECIKCLDTCLGSIECIAVDQTSQRAAFCTNEQCFIIGFFGNKSKPLTEDHAGYCCKCGRKIDKKPATCSKCHRFFCMNCYQKRFSIIKAAD